MKTGARITGAGSLVRKFREHPGLILRTTESVLKQEARALCVEYGAATMPLGMSDGSGESFGKRVVADVGRVFAVRSNPNQIFQMMKVHAPELANAYWHAFKASKPRSMAAILRKANLPQGVDAAVHKAARTGRKGRVGKLAAPLRLGNEAQVRTFARKQRALVGFAKAGWYCAAKGLGGRVRRNLVGANGSRKTEEIFPKYVRTLARKFPDAGGARITISRTKVTVEIFTRVRHAEEALPARLYQAATSAAEHRMANALTHAVAELNKKKFGGRGRRVA